MRRMVILIVLLACCAGMCLSCMAQKASSSADISGAWNGTLDAAGTKLRLIFTVTVQADGSLKAVMTSVDQGGAKIAADATTFKGNRLLASFKSIAGVFDGKLNAAGDGFEGTWTQGAAAFPLVLKKGDKLDAKIVPKRPQEPKRPFPYDEIEVSYPNPKSGNTLAGTLTVPRSGGPFPVALLITGSGPQDRDEALMGHKPFLILSDYLTRRGIAVLRVDDRGVAKSTGNFATATTLDFADDVRAGIAYLKTRKEIDPKKIGLIGHSEGGLIGPMVAAKSPDVAFVVMMAGPGITGEKILYLQQALLSKALGASDDVIAQNRKVNEQLFAVAMTEKDDAVAAQKIQAIVAKLKAGMSEEARKAGGAAIDAQVEGQTKALLSPWFRFFLAYDPRAALTRVKCPLLAINGEKDMQVPPKDNLPVIEAALKEGGNKDFTVKQLPGLNHLFQTADTGAVSEYATIEETMSPIALKTMGDWIVAHTGAK